MDPHSAFTYTLTPISNKLYNDIVLSYDGKEITVTALWDTGATMSAISHSVVNDLSLVSVGKQIVSTPAGKKEVSTYCIDAKLPNKVEFNGLMVTDSEIGSQIAGNKPIGMLVGMDIIGKGDFAVTNRNGQTVFTYRYPSMEVIDFVKKIKVAKIIGQTHGKGKGGKHIGKK